MEANGRVRLNITKNSRGYGWDMTVERSNDVLHDSRYEVINEIELFKKMVEEMIHEWEMEDARKTQA